MFTRLKRTATSLLAVLAVFGVYRLAAEPFIDPPVVEKRVAKPNDVDVVPLAPQNRLGPYLRYFPEGSWERDNPLMLESDTVKALVKDYRVGNGRDLPKNCIELRPCTLLFLPDGEVETPDSRRRVVIMRTQEDQSAVLQFENEVDISRLQLGKLTGAEIKGSVLIYSAATRPEGGDDLEVHARDIKMVGNEIASEHPVQFRFGPSHGSGRDMRITLLPAQNGGTSIGPSISGIQDFKLMREVQMHLQPGDAGILPGDEQAQQKNASRNRPVDIRCTGPFTFDLVAYVAEFHDDVVVMRSNEMGPADQLTGGLLSIFFAERELTPAEKAAKKAQAKTQQTVSAEPKPGAQRMPRLVPQRFEARGYPVEVSAPSNSVYAIGTRMEYDIRTGRISLETTEGSPPVHLKVREVNEAKARTLHYQPAPQGMLLGKLYSQGPGWLKATPAEESTDQISARWADKLELRPDKDKHLLSIVGEAHVEYTGQGQIDANEIYLWLNELSAAAVPIDSSGRTAPLDNRSNSLAAIRSRVQPDGLLAKGKVHIESPQLRGDLEELKTWFRTGALASAAPQSSTGFARNQNHPRSTNDPRSRQPAPPQEHYEIACRLLETGLALNGSHSELEFAILTDNVKFDQTPPVPGEQSPLGIRGNWLKVERANAPDSQVTVSGQPASILAQGMTMRGTNVNLDRGANRMWIEGPGEMHWEGRQNIGQIQPASMTNAPRQPPSLTNRGPLDVAWQERMDFDGRTVRFIRGVVAKQVSIANDQSDEQSIRNEQLEVTLRDRVDFANSRARQQQPEVELLTARGDALLENLSFKNGQPVSADRMKLTDLTVNQITGATRSQGPGIAKSWRFGRRPQLSIPGRPASSNNSQNAAEENQITYSQIEFQNGISGNMLEDRREVNFLDQVRGIFGPVPNWQTELVDEDMQPGKMVLHSDQLKVSQLPRAADGSMPVFVNAEGGTRVEGMGEEGQIYSASGNTLSYDRGKDLLVLNGDGRIPAQVVQQDRIGAPPRSFNGPTIKGSPTKGSFSGQIQSSSGSMIAPAPAPRVTSPPQNPPR